ncbi:AraC family transcriptional regulator [Solwaraspora sp. WMMD792]|uniref:AraC family transcriptional regulator n=1 Tax=Solwaraspora sp. WMMD792 TaxID=3016099 RepID=UPI002416EB87|nr:AraC family transcriptional regulator [Solwaraspora sp. WMMD792]MDG4769126.1 AraC family transcriptional regulator [Solwaraspora sp. WMMD792]
MAKLEVDAPWVSVDPVGEALHLLRMTGIFYCRTEVSAPWALEMPPFGDCLSFHVVTSGGCWLRVGDAPPRQLSAGDLALVPHGRGHLLLSSPQAGQAGRAGRVDLLPQEHLNAHYSILRHGGGGETSTLVCAVVSFEGPAAHQLVRLLPPVIHATGSDPRTSGWIGATLALLTSEVSDLRPGGEAVTTRLADILVIQAIRSWIDSDDPQARAGWLGALSDPLIGRAIAAIHREPSRTWTVASLARVAAMSRSSFAARFTRLVGEPALQYVTRWRMHVALARLEQGQTTVRELAGQSGYGSEAAFSRAFKRMIGVAPGSVRSGRDPSASPH